MSEQNLAAMTVLELRKLAKELRVPLSAGISKQGIVERLSAAMGSAPAAEAAAPAPAEEAANEAPAAEEKSDEDKPDEPAEPTPATGVRPVAAAPRFNARPAYQAPAYGNRSSAPRPPMETPRTQTTRPVGFTPRFGPAAQEAPAAPQEERPTYQAPERRPAFGDAPRFQQRPAYEPRPAQETPARPAFEQQPYQAPRPAYEPRPVQEQRPAYEPRPHQEQRPAYEPRPESRPSMNEMLAPAECPEGSGVLELHPDGYGFLRSESLLPTAKDIFVAASQVRRFGLRPGDHIVGRIRPQRDGDKYAAMLYLTTVNGVAPDAIANRPSFDELTAIYPTRRIRLLAPNGKTPDDLRLMDLLAPIGFGQRGLIVCPPGVAKRSLLAHLAMAIRANHPDALVSAVLFNETPENVTLLRDQVPCPVLASTFDMQPEYHLRLADLCIEKAQRMVEMKKDVVLLVDSLTTLSRIFTAAAMQQGRVTPSSISPGSLQKAKRIFGSARCLREGGSLTVIAVMNNDPASKLDEAIINDFRGAANMELTLDASLAQKGIKPAIDPIFSGTKRAEGLQTPAERDGLKLIRSALREVPPAQMIPELLSMLDKAGSGDDLLQRIQEWMNATRG